MSQKTAIRDAFGYSLRDLGYLNSQIVVLEADVGSSTKSSFFGKEFKNRYFNVGIAEQNMTAMAAGLAIEGFIPFVNTFATFMVTRAADPIKSLIAYDNLNVKLCGAYSGLSDSYDGASHHSIEDIAFFRALPNMTIISVCDPIETKKAVKAIADYNGPVYLRLSRAEVNNIFDENYDFKIGQGVILKEGCDVSIVATGYMIHKALEAANILKQEGIMAQVINIHTIKPIDKQILIESAKKTGAMVTVEEHSVYGGLGSSVAEVLSENYPIPISFIGVEQFGESGDYEQLLSKMKLNTSDIIRKVKEVISKKREVI